MPDSDDAVSRRRLEKIDSPEYVALRQGLKDGMERRFFKQRQVSKILGRHPSWVNEVLHGRRSLEFMEIVDFCEAIGLPPAELFAKILA